MQAGVIGLGHSCGLLCSPIGRKGPATPSPAILAQKAKGLPSRAMCHVPFLPPSKLSLMADGRCLGRRVLSTAALDSLPPNAALGRPLCTSWASSFALWAPSGHPLPTPTPTPSACLEPCPAPGCSSPALPRGFPVCPRPSPRLPMCRQGCLPALPSCTHWSSVRGNSTKA